VSARPWRAVASLRFGPGIPPITLARTSAKTRPGLDRFVDRHAAEGAHVEVWEVLPVPEVAAQVAAGLPG
jgi:hypothetical protein